MLDGALHPDFGIVAHRLRKIMPKSGFGGAAVTVYHKGEKVVDIWGGTTDDARTPWREDTISLSFSTTKGMASTLLHILIDEGRADYDDPVAKHWPEFGKNGKERITIRQIMCHEAGLYHLYDMIDDAHEMLDWATMIERLENAAPCHQPGTAHGYHALTYGWLVGELAQRLSNDTFSNLLRDKIAEPLGLDGFYCGLPDSEKHRRATLKLPAIKSDNAGGSALAAGPSRKFRTAQKIVQTASFGKFDLSQGPRALSAKGMNRFDFNSDATVSAVIPAANGCFTARSLARVYAALANGGEIDGVRLISPEGIARATQVQNTKSDRVLLIPQRWRLGYHRVYDWFGPKCPNGFGHFGFGGSGGWADPDRNLSIGFILNHGVGTPMGNTWTTTMSRAALDAADLRR